MPVAISQNYRVIAVKDTGQRVVISAHQTRESAQLAAGLMIDSSCELKIEKIHRSRRRPKIISLGKAPDQ